MKRGSIRENKQADTPSEKKEFHKGPHVIPDRRSQMPAALKNYVLKQVQVIKE